MILSQIRRNHTPSTKIIPRCFSRTYFSSTDAAKGVKNALSPLVVIVTQEHVNVTAGTPQRTLVALSHALPIHRHSVMLFIWVAY